MSPNPIRILIADGRKLLREGISLLLDKCEDISVAGEASDVSSAVRLIGPLEIQVVVLVLPAPGDVGAALVREILAACPRVRVVTVGSGESAQRVRAILGAGAVGCLTKECASEELIAAIRDAAIGRRHLSPQLGRLVVSGFAPVERTQALLSAREAQVLRAIAMGRNTKQIAYELRVARKTIETHRRRLMIKLDRYSVAELTQYAIVTGLIQIETPVEV
jgi:DNA-binding NarL/FixJ family response regulator